MHIASHCIFDLKLTCVPDGAGRLKTEDFSGDPRNGSSTKGFIGFGEERGVMIE